MLLGSADSWSPLNPPRTGYHQGYPKAVDPTRQGSRGNILIRNTTPSEQALMECSACAEEVSPPHTGWSNRCEATGTVPRRGKSIAYCENRRSDEREKPVLDCVYQTVHQQMFILSRTFAQHGLCAVRGRFDFSSHRHFCWVSNLGEDEKQGIICAVCAAAVFPNGAEVSVSWFSVAYPYTPIESRWLMFLVSLSVRLALRRAA